VCLSADSNFSRFLPNFVVLSSIALLFSIIQIDALGFRFGWIVERTSWTFIVIVIVVLTVLTIPAHSFLRTIFCLLASPNKTIVFVGKWAMVRFCEVYYLVAR